MDSAGRIVVGDGGHHRSNEQGWSSRIRVIESGKVTMVAGKDGGGQAFRDETVDGAALSAVFNTPEGITVDASELLT